MLARRLEPPPIERRVSRGAKGAAADRAQGRWRSAGRRPTRDPRGHVIRWWDRSAPRGDEALWRAVMVIQEERLRVGLTVTDLARRVEAAGHPLRRETLSRVLQGKQATTWATVDALGRALGMALDDVSWPRAG